MWGLQQTVVVKQLMGENSAIVAMTPAWHLVAAAASVIPTFAKKRPCHGESHQTPSRSSYMWSSASRRTNAPSA